MKLRVRGSSLRLRLTQREVEELASRGIVEDAIAFAPATRLVYALRVSDEALAPSARFDGARIDVTLPASDARAWSSSDRIGIEAEQPIGDGALLRILVEKDFACLAPRKGEDDGDAFPNPSACK